MKKLCRKTTEINSGSMADIAFLLLIFFLVSTTMQTDKGLVMKLPPEKNRDQMITPINERNLYKININSNNKILVEGQPFQGFDVLHKDLKAFILNYGYDHHLSDDPESAVVSIKMNRGTSYHQFIDVLDAVQGVYYEIYGEKIGLSADEFRGMDIRDEKQYALYSSAREGIPMNISIAEPNKIQ